MLFCALLVYVLHLAYAVLSHRLFFADGTSEFLTLLRTEGAVYGDDGRAWARFVLHMPAALAIKAGLRDLDLLAYIFGATVFFVPVISLGICLAAVRRRPELMVFPLLSLFAGSMNSEFQIISKSLFLAHLYWPLVFLSLFSRSTKALAAVCLLAAATLQSYQSMLFFGLILAGIAIWRGRQSRPVKHVAVIWYGLALWFLAGVGIAILTVVKPTSESNLQGFLRASVLFFLEGRRVHAPAVLSLVLLAILVVIVCRQDMNRRCFFLIGLGWSTACAFVALLPILWPTGLAVNLQHHARVLNVYLPVALTCAVLAVHVGWLAIRPVTWRRAFLLVALLGISQGIWHLGATYEWTRYLGVFRHELQSNVGLVPFEETALARLNQPPLRISRRMNWSWNIPSMSIVLAQEGDVRTIIDEPASRRGRRRRFDPAIPEELPELSRYGVSYGQYLQALTQGRIEPPEAEGTGSGAGLLIGGQDE